MWCKVTNTQLPKQTIERIEREVNDHDGEGSEYCDGYETGATREALLVLPVLNAAKRLRDLLQRAGHTTDASRELYAALTNYEALNKESGK